MAYEPKTGDVVGAWTLGDQLGEGGMGRVFRATNPLGKEAAVKIVKADLARDTVFRRRFDREASIARRVDHPHVVPVIDKGEHEGIPYLAQVFVPGGSLEARIQARGKLPLDEAVRICTAVASGLDALHEQG